MIFPHVGDGFSHILGTHPWVPYSSEEDAKVELLKLLGAHPQLREAELIEIAEKRYWNVVYWMVMDGL